MNAIRMILLSVSLGLGARGWADEPVKPDSTLEIIQFKAPAGWKVTEGAAGRPVRVFIAPDSVGPQQTIILILLSPAQPDLDLSKAFDAAIKEVTSNGKVLESTDPVAARTRQGFDAISRTLVTQGAGDQRLYARMIAAKVQNRMAGIYYLATTKDLYDQHQPEMAAFLQSVSFTETAANPLGANPLGANPTAASAELASLEKQKQELLSKIAEIEARQRQLTSGVAPAARANVVPQDDPLAKARDQFAKDVAARRKAHVISGDILALDGKPIVNVSAYRVFVWGTTIAAEKTSYGLEVDQNGHFEQQVPDGLYQLDAKCIITQAGHRVPVDLVWLDDRKVGVVQASAAGIVRDFRLVLNGLRPGEDPKSDRAFFGGSLRVNGPQFELRRGSFSVRHPGARVLLTLTAQSALADGSRMDPITVDMDPSEINYTSVRRNIPVAVYKASVVLVAKDGSKTALPCSNNFNGPYGDSAEIFWESVPNDPESRGDPSIYLKD